MSLIKTIGSFLGIEVKAHLPSNPLEAPFCTGWYKNKLVTTDVISFSREAWDEGEVLTQCFNHVFGITITILLENGELDLHPFNEQYHLNYKSYTECEQSQEKEDT